MSRGAALFELSIKGDFSSAHFLRGYDGPCKDLHGHTWKVEIVIRSPRLDKIGLVVDFRMIKRRLKDFLMHIDHVNLNELAYFKKVNPSTENLAKYIYKEFGRQVKPLKIKSVIVWESEVASVKYFEGQGSGGK